MEGKYHLFLFCAWAGFLLFSVLAIVIYPFEWNLALFNTIQPNDNTVLSVLGSVCIGIAVWIFKLDHSLREAIAAKGNSRIIYAWSGFVFFNVLTRIIYSYGYAIEPYLLVLSVLGITSVGFALWVLKINRFSWRSIILIVVGLLFGQLWVVLGVTLFLSWSLVGFAP